MDHIGKSNIKNHKSSFLKSEIENFSEFNPFDTSR